MIRARSGASSSARRRRATADATQAHPAARTTSASGHGDGRSRVAREVGLESGASRSWRPGPPFGDAVRSSAAAAADSAHVRPAACATATVAAAAEPTDLPAVPRATARRPAAAASRAKRRHRRRTGSRCVWVACPSHVRSPPAPRRARPNVRRQGVGHQTVRIQAVEPRNSERSSSSSAARVDQTQPDAAPRRPARSARAPRTTSPPKPAWERAPEPPASLTPAPERPLQRSGQPRARRPAPATDRAVRRRRGRHRPGRQERERIEIAVRIVGLANAQVHMRFRRDPIGARADGADGRAGLDGGVLRDGRRAQLEERHREALGREDRDRTPAVRHAADEGDGPGGGSPDGRALRCADVDPAVLSGGVRIRRERERTHHRAVHGPGPAVRGGRDTSVVMAIAAESNRRMAYLPPGLRGRG